MTTAIDDLPIGGPNPPPEHKLASRVTDRIVRDIAADGWVVGRVVGSETELIERYDISRAVFRESVRLLEHLGVATTKRGPGGGLITTEPSTASVVQAFMVYLTFTDMSLSDLMEARVSLEQSIAGLAAERANEQQIEQLRARVIEDRDREQLDSADHHVLHTMIGSAARNPAAELFIDVLGRLTSLWAYPVVDTAARRAAIDASARAHGAIVDAITAGNSSLAERRMGIHLGALSEWLVKDRKPPRSLDSVLDDHNAESKLGSRVARSIVVDVVDRGWPIGDVLGSESDLMLRHGVSRSAIREAVRLLEYHEVAVMKRGPSGGLVVTPPTIDPIIRAATVFLEQRGITASDLIALRRNLESDAVALVTKRATSAAIDELRVSAASHAMEGFEGPVDEEFHVRIAQLTGNPAITLFVRVLVHLTRVHAVIPGQRSPRRSGINAETDHAHRAILDALTERDASLAQRRIVKHLTAMEPLLR